MSEWKFDLDNMLCWHIDDKNKFKIRYDSDKNVVYLRGEEVHEDWARCRSEITEEFLVQASLCADEIILGSNK